MEPPNFGIFNEDQTKCIVTSENNVLFINLTSKLEIDIVEQEGIAEI